MARIDAFFKLMSEQKASDLHLSTNNPPMLRINGDLVRVDYPALKDEELKTMVYEIAPETSNYSKRISMLTLATKCRALLVIAPISSSKNTGSPRFFV
jgi:Tfp pilus assembly pilus retraction ATPase PilT